MAKRSDGIETRNRILGAAARLFSEKGFRQTSNADISRASGVNSALISYYFGDKETIYREAWRHSLRAALPVDFPRLGSVRGGGIVGEHEVLFCGPEEVVTISHSAQSRGVFADGAIQAALFVDGAQPGYYTMTDMLRGKMQCI